MELAIPKGNWRSTRNPFLGQRFLSDPYILQSSEITNHIRGLRKKLVRYSSKLQCNVAERVHGEYSQLVRIDLKTHEH
jgi:hypothetical protein